VLHVVQLHSSFCEWGVNLSSVVTSRMYFLTLRLVFLATGQLPVHIPHWMHSRSLCFWVSS